MARARNIKPGFYKNEDLAECSVWARLIFPGLWMLADREGRLEDRPKRIKGELLPYDNIDIGPLLEELSKFGFILRYQVGEERYIQICKFSEHQTPHVREQASTIPKPPDAVQSTTKVVTSSDLDDGEQLPRSPESLFSDSLNPDSLNPDSVPPAKRDEYPASFEDSWSEYPSRPGASKKDAFKAWSARIKAGVGVDVLAEGVRRYARYVVAMKTEPQYIKQPATFFGPGEHYLCDWSVAQPRTSTGAAGGMSKAGQATAAAAQRLIEKMRLENEQAN